MRTGDIEMDNFAPLMRHHDQDVKQATSYRRDHQEIHGGHGAGVVSQKGPPVLGWSAPGLGPVFSNRGRRGVQTKFGQFILDAGTAPRRVGNPHLPDESNQLWILSRATTAGPGLPSP